MLRILLLYPAIGLALVTGVVVLLRGRIPAVGAMLVAGIGTLAFVVFAVVEPGGGQDVVIFWRAGRAVWEGVNPYADRYMLTPPPGLPLFALLGVTPFTVTLWLWKVLNILGCLALVEGARRALKAQEPGWELPLSAAGVLTGVLVLSFPARYGLELGQMAVFTTLCLLAALHLQGRGRPAWAGVFLALASAKAATMLPFLLLFVRKKDLLTWPALAAAGFGLALAATPPADLVGHCRQCLESIAYLGRPGGFNDYSYANPSSSEVFGLDHALYRLGLRDRGVIAATQLALLGLLAALLVWLQVRKRALPRGAACAVVACYSALFLYHRFYDMVVLVLPLAYCAGRVAAGKGASRALHSFAGLVVLAVLYLRLTTLREITASTLTHTDAGSRLLQALVLPYGTWLLVAAMLALVAAQFLHTRPAGAPETLPEVVHPTRQLVSAH
jgi:hypothetical protein